MPAFSHFFLKRFSARSKFSSSWMITSDKSYFPPFGVCGADLGQTLKLGATQSWVKRNCISQGSRGGSATRLRSLNRVATPSRGPPKCGCGGDPPIDHHPCPY